MTSVQVLSVRMVPSDPDPDLMARQLSFLKIDVRTDETLERVRRLFYSKDGRFQEFFCINL